MIEALKVALGSDADYYAIVKGHESLGWVIVKNNGSTVTFLGPGMMKDVPFNSEWLKAVETLRKK